MASNATVDINRVEPPPSQTIGDAAEELFPDHHPGLTLQDLRRMLGNEPAGFVIISSQGWIIATVIFIAKFMAKLTGSQLAVHSWENVPLQEAQTDSSQRGLTPICHMQNGVDADTSECP